MKQAQWQVQQIAAKISCMKDRAQDTSLNDCQKQRAIQEAGLEAIDMILKNMQHWIAQV